MEFSDFGGRTVQFILQIAAELFTSESAPGWMSLVLLAALIVLSIWHFLSSFRFRLAVKSARSIFQYGPLITGESLIKIDQDFNDLKSEQNKGFRHQLAIAWDEFRETTIIPEAETDQLKNTVRPAMFFHREELGLDRGMWRQVPALFVSVGLFLTFLGLVAALDQTGRILDGVSEDDEGATAEGLKMLLSIAGTKFIMSLTGLLCSILFTLVLRYNARKLDEALHALCADIENGCMFLSEQTILGKMLQQAKEQTDHLKSFSTELVAQIAQPLREDLPNSIREAVHQAVGPLVETISQGTTEGIEGLVGSVSGQLTESVRDSVLLMNNSIEEVRNGLETVTNQLDRSVGTMSKHMDESVQSLVRQTEGLEKTAEILSRSIQESVTAAAEASGYEIRSAGQEMASGISAATTMIRDNFLDPMNTLAERIQRLASGVETATVEVEGYAESVKKSATSVVSANEGLGRSVETLTAATTPVRDVVAGIASATRAMGDRVDAASEAMLRTTEHTETIMRGTRAAIRASRNTMQEAVDSVKHAVTEFKGVIDRYRKIDESLGDAFQEIERAVKSSIKEISQFEQKLNEEFGRALNRLEAVIAQAEPFMPGPEE